MSAPISLTEKLKSKEGTAHRLILRSLNVKIKRSKSMASSSSSKKRKKSKKRYCESSSSSEESDSDSSSSSSSSSSSDSDDRSRKRKKRKTKRKHKRSRSSSSSSSSSSSPVRKKKKKKDHKKQKKKKKKSKKKMKKSKSLGEMSVPDSRRKEISVNKSTKKATSAGTSGPEPRVMKPMTKEEWEKQQSVVRRVYDPETGRTRLVKGDGEILEEIVSKERHKEISKQATQGDGLFFQRKLGITDR
ncbi:uncharacterized protein LOC111132936 [Crassostrea virginica]